jgi:hypothetical protein
MDTTRFDTLTSSLAATSTRRGALRFLAATAFGLSSLAVLGGEESVARRRGGKKKKGGRGKGGRGGSRGASKSLGQICSPGRDTCAAGLQCSSPTTRHSCSSTVEGIANLCCLPPGSVCSTECDCCGDYYCSYDNNNVGHCEPNPEG